MLHNHLRNFTSHELAIDLHAADQSDDRADSVYQLRRGVEIARYHTRGLVDARKTVTLRESGGCSQKKGCRKKKMFLCHRLFLNCAGRVDSPSGGLILIIYLWI